MYWKIALDWHFLWSAPADAALRQLRALLLEALEALEALRAPAQLTAVQEPHAARWCQGVGETAVVYHGGFN